MRLHWGTEIFFQVASMAQVACGNNDLIKQGSINDAW